MSRIIGHFDGVEGTRASGWVADAEAPNRVLAVAFFRVGWDGRATELGTVRANRPREDLRTIGLDDVNHGFEWRVPFSPQAYRLSARLAEDGRELSDSPVDVTPRPFYEGTFDGIERGVLRGWAWAWDPSIAVTVEVFVDGSVRGTAPAKTERPDLSVARIGTGRHGFAWIVPDELTDGLEHEFACRIVDTSVWLAGTPKTAVILPGERSLGLKMAEVVRGCARRPQPQQSTHRSASMPRWWPSLGSWDFGRRAQESIRAPARQTIGPIRGEFSPLWDIPHRAPPVPASGRSGGVRLLIPVWGEEYITTFCRTALPSLLSPNNLPYLAGVYPLTVVFLTRHEDRGLFEEYPAYRRLGTVASIVFTDIDDVLARYFDPCGDAYATALTYAFFCGMRAVGAAACDTDFLFWNADFLAADGVFRTLTELMAAGVRCTFAPSLRVDRAVEDAVLASRRTEGDAVLDIGPREWVALAARFPHPTVMAQTVNRFEERMIDSVNQLYWQINDELTVGRTYLMFMLHIRPECVWEELYGHCDYVFVPEMVPSGDYHFETQSDRLLILELQQHNREGQDIVYGDATLTASEVAQGVDRWTTREHRRCSRQLVVFNTGDIGDLAPARQLTDQFMDGVYGLLSDEPVWHNGHFFWTDSLASLGLSYEEPGPDHPRSHLAAALRWTGYDIDVLRESWPGAAGPPDELFAVELPLPADFDAAAWLAAAHARYFQAWREVDAAQLADPALTDLVAGHFHGFGWGLVERHDNHWVRPLGPDGRAALLLRAPRGRGAQISLFGASGRFEGLGVYVNGRSVTDLHESVRAGQSTLRFDIGRDAVGDADGRVHILLYAPPTVAAAFTGLAISIR